jgi:hypothetical protein
VSVKSRSFRPHYSESERGPLRTRVGARPRHAPRAGRDTPRDAPAPSPSCRTARLDVRVDHDRVPFATRERRPPGALFPRRASPFSLLQRLRVDGRGRPRARRRLARGEARRAPAPPAPVRRVRAPVLRVRARRPGRAPLPRAGGLLPELAPVQVLRLGDVRVAARGVRDALEGCRKENDVTARTDTYALDAVSAQTRRSPRKTRRRDGEKNGDARGRRGG